MSNKTTDEGRVNKHVVFNSRRCPLATASNPQSQLRNPQSFISLVIRLIYLLVDLGDLVEKGF